jgi:hypothetical protein
MTLPRSLAAVLVTTALGAPAAARAEPPPHAWPRPSKPLPRATLAAGWAPIVIFVAGGALGLGAGAGRAPRIAL